MTSSSKRWRKRPGLGHGTMGTNPDGGRFATTGPARMGGQRVLLFERVVEGDPMSKSREEPFRVHDRVGLMASVANELEMLFSTRAMVGSEHAEPGERTVLNYGVPDFLSFCPLNPNDRIRLARYLESAIQSFEPRLKAPKVTVRLSPGGGEFAVAVVQGHLMIENVVEQVAFDIPFDVERAVGSHGK